MAINILEIEKLAAKKQLKIEDILNAQIILDLDSSYTNIDQVIKAARKEAVNSFTVSDALKYTMYGLIADGSGGGGGSGEVPDTPNDGRVYLRSRGAWRPYTYSTKDIWVDSDSTSDITPNGTDIAPYKTLAAARAAISAGDSSTLHWASGSSFNESITINNATNQSYVSDNVVGQFRAEMIGNLNITGACKSLGFGGFQIKGNTTISSTLPLGGIYFDNVAFNGTIDETGTQYSKYNNCEFMGNHTISGTGNTYIEIVGGATTSENASILIIDNPNAIVHIAADAWFTINVKQCRALIANTNYAISTALSTEYAVIVEDTNQGLIDLKGTARDTTTGLLLPIQIRGGIYSVNLLDFSKSSSDINAVNLAEETLDATLLKDTVLAPVTIDNTDSDPDLAIGVNGRFFITNTNITHLPVAEIGILEVASNPEKTHTFQHYLTATGDNYYRNSTSTITINEATDFYKITATSGSKSVYDSLVVREYQDNLLVRTQIRSNFDIDESSSSIILASKVSFYIDDTSYLTDGFQITITREQGIGTGTITLNVASDGTITPTEEYASAANSYIKYQSAIINNSGGTQMDIYLSFTWTNYTGSITWTNWVQN